MKQYINLTPHVLNVGTMEIPSTGLCRVKSTNGIQLEDELYSGPQWGEVEGLPAPEEGVIYIVSMVVAARVGSSREDVFYPGTGPTDGAIRDEFGKIIGVTRLIRSY
jgi:hypothetical protein